MAIDQKAIAQILGVSQPTVSRALNGSRKVSDELRAKVLTLAEHMGYVPDFPASSLSSGRTGIISVMLSDMPTFAMSVLHSQWYSHLQNYAASRGVKLRIDRPTEYETIVRNRSTDALIVFGFPGAPGNPITREGCPLPVVFTDCVGSKAANTVSIDNFGGVAKAVQHMVDMGHRKMAFAGHTRHSGQINQAHERHRGYVQTLNDLGLPMPSKWTITQDEWPYEPSDCQRYESQVLLSIDEGVTAIVCSSDMMAVGLAKVLMRNGHSIPGDVSIIGFDDSMIARIFEPPLSAVRQDTEKASRFAIDMLIGEMNGSPWPEGVIVEAPLVSRGTEAPPREAK